VQKRGDVRVQRATRVFAFETRPGDSPLVERIWRTRSEPVERFISVAATQWEMVVTRLPDRAYLTVRGPETKATISPIPEGADFFGITFRLGVFMPALPSRVLADSSFTLPDAGGGSFWLNSSAWEFPDYANADVFVQRLQHEGLLVFDALVQAAAQREVHELSVRTVERRVMRATGLTRGAIRQIERALKASELLDHGVPILATVARAGYADQAHLTRSLRRFVGQTPRRYSPRNPRSASSPEQARTAAVVFFQDNDTSAAYATARNHFKDYPTTPCRKSSCRCLCRWMVSRNRQKSGRSTTGMMTSRN
jgi:AraC-like DNA-binding protein